MRKDTERVAIVMKRDRSGLVPASAFDAELLDRYSLSAEVEVTVKQRCSLPQQRLYWSILHAIVEATDAYPNAEYLHEAIKDELGYVHHVRRIDGQTIRIPDSTAFAKMDQAEFKVFFDRAMELLARLIGSDPMELTRNAA